jgi:CBS domain-containing protein
MGLRQNLKNEPVSKLSLRPAVTLKRDVLVRHAVEAMRGAHLGCVVIIDGNERLVGIFTEGMLRHMLVHDVSQLEEPLEQHMAVQCPWVTLDDPISTVLDAMQEKNVRFAVVIGDDRRVVGLTGQKGLMEYIAEHFPDQVMVQRIGGTPYTTSREGA